ncbi:MAG TPA: Ig-like domain-containing protein [Longimicrobiales bacterium]|nr:Ig-like domain-containing protein [Longimicrobiales bacterium]
MKSHRIAASLFVVTLSLAACGDNLWQVPSGSEIVAENDNQTGLAGASLAAPLRIRVVDEGGNGVPGVSVSWIALGGGLLAPDERTDANGYAEATWVLPTRAGTVSARVQAGTLSHSFYAKTLPAAPVSLELGVAALDLERDGTAPIAVDAVDEHGNEVGAELLTWSSSDERIASVSDDGIVTAHRRGETVITVAGGGMTADVQVTVPGAAWKEIGTGAFYTCGLTGDGRAWCWGENFAGRLGIASSAPYVSTPQPVAGNHTFDRIIPGTASTCALTANGAAWCWGTSFSGELGVSANGARFDTPVRVADGLTFDDFGMGSAYACGLTAFGELYCWGAAPHLTEPTHVPSRVDAGPFIDFAAGEYHACGLDVEGSVWCWGEGIHGELGHGDMLSSTVPVKVSGDRQFTSLAAGWRRTCAIDVQERAVCWGVGLYQEHVPTPRVVNGTRAFVALAIGPYYTCGLTADGAAYCWGWSGSGGVGSVFDTRTWLLHPTRVDAAEEFTSIAADGIGDHTCAITVQREAWCWGSNQYGQIGDASPGVDRHTPVRVHDPPVQP